MLFGLFFNELPFSVGPNKRGRFNVSECQRLFNYEVHFPEGEISDEAKDLILNLLRPKEERLTVEEALNHPWFNLLQEAPQDNEREEAYQAIGDVEINDDIEY